MIADDRVGKIISRLARNARRTMNRVALDASDGSLAFAKDQLRRHWPMWVGGRKTGGWHRVYRDGQWTSIPYGPGE